MRSKSGSSSVGAYSVSNLQPPTKKQKLNEDGRTSILSASASQGLAASSAFPATAPHPKQITLDSFAKLTSAPRSTPTPTECELSPVLPVVPPVSASCFSSSTLGILESSPVVAGDLLQSIAPPFNPTTQPRIIGQLPNNMSAVGPLYVAKTVNGSIGVFSPNNMRRYLSSVDDNLEMGQEIVQFPNRAEVEELYQLFHANPEISNNTLNITVFQEIYHYQPAKSTSLPV